MHTSGNMKDKRGGAAPAPAARRRILLSLAGSISSESADSLRKTLRKLRKHPR
jgi:hypothetical protein